MGIAGRLAETINNTHKMAVEVSFCSRFRAARSECAVCARFCPVDAIDILENGVAITGGCISCGVCLSTCPTGTFRTKERDDEEIIEGINARGKRQGRDLFRISCERGEATADLLVPCLSRLTEGMLLEPIRAGASGVAILQPACEECPLSKAAPHLETVIGRAHSLCDMMGVERKMILKTKIPLRDEMSDPGKSVSRRELFQSLRAKSIGIAAASIPESLRKDLGNEKDFKTVVRDKQENLKRALLLQCIRDRESWSRNPILRSRKQTRVSSKDAMSEEVEVTSGCIACGTCATLCPTGAITRYITEDSIYLGFRPHLCTNCQVCARTCMRMALQIREEVSLDLLLEDKEIRIFEGKKKVCAICRIDFVGERSDVCPLCEDRKRKQAVVLQF